MFFQLSIGTSFVSDPTVYPAPDPKLAGRTGNTFCINSFRLWASWVFRSADILVRLEVDYAWGADKWQCWENLRCALCASAGIRNSLPCQAEHAIPDVRRGKLGCGDGHLWLCVLPIFRTTFAACGADLRVCRLAGPPVPRAESGDSGNWQV